ncbi:MAG: alpha/beta hydrolase [Jatrophihabitans sp.]|uniref:alpha/beta hydrolase n=1 Tax=Jatrophihabitans sp. TaxID=1932789 RepID=UPI00390DDAAD
MSIPLRTAAFWSVYKLIERAPVMQQPVEKVRAAADLRNKALGLPLAWLITGRPARGVDITETEASAADGTPLPLRVYRPKGAAGRLPVVLNFHGGAWVSGSVLQSEWWASALAARAGVVVVSVEYRLAPEHSFPTPVEDCYDATRWVAQHAEEFGVDADRLAVMGDSAGGNMAAVVAMMARDRGEPSVALQVLIYPSVELGGEYPSERENANRPILTSKDIVNAPGLYFHESTREMTDPYASPIRGKLEGLPPALIQTAEFDPLRDHGAYYAEALRAAGVEVRSTNYVEAVHGYISLPGIQPVARQALAEAAAEIRRHLDP